MSDMESWEEYRECWAWILISGSRAEGLALEDDWGHKYADMDWMRLHGGPLGVYLPGQQPRGRSCLDFHLGGCPPAYCKLQISDLPGLNESIVVDGKWCDDSCIEKSSDGVMWLHTQHAVKCMAASDHFVGGESVSGPASVFGEVDFVNTLVCSAAHPDLDREFVRRARGPWPTVPVINYLIRLPMLLVLVGHKLSPEFRLQARVSWSHLEYKLIKELPESIRQGYIACKYIMKRFLEDHRGQNEAADGRSKIGSYHVKTVFLNFLEKKNPIIDYVPICFVSRPFLRVGSLSRGG